MKQGWMKSQWMCFVVGFVVSGWSWSSMQSPVQILDQAAQDVIHVLKSHQNELQSNPKIIQRAVEQYLVPHLDVAGMSRSVLGRDAWMQASAQQKQAFSQAFLQLVIRTYSAPLAQYHGEKVQFMPLNDASSLRFAQVRSQIIRPQGPPLPLNYSLVLKNGQWKVYDLTVEGVSLLQSYHAQFEQVLQRSNLNDLIQQIQNTKKVVS